MDYTWTVDGDQIGTGEYTTYIFSSIGAYYVTVTVSDTPGNANDAPQTATVLVNVVAPPQQPPTPDPPIVYERDDTNIKNVINALGFCEYSTHGGERNPQTGEYSVGSVADSWYLKRIRAGGEVNYMPQAQAQVHRQDQEHGNSQRISFTQNDGTLQNDVLYFNRDVYLDPSPDWRRYGDLAIDPNQFLEGNEGAKQLRISFDIKAPKLNYTSITVGIQPYVLDPETYELLEQKPGCYEKYHFNRIDVISPYYPVRPDYPHRIVASPDWQHKEMAFYLPKKPNPDVPGQYIIPNLITIQFFICAESSGRTVEADAYIDNVILDAGYTLADSNLPKSIGTLGIYLNNDPDPEESARQYDIVVLPPRMHDNIHNLKHYNPNIKVLLYQGLISSLVPNSLVTYENLSLELEKTNTAIGYKTLYDNKWLLYYDNNGNKEPVIDKSTPPNPEKETKGAQIAYPGHSEYRETWAEQALAFVKQVGADGIFMDGANAFRSWTWDPTTVYAWINGQYVQVYQDDSTFRNDIGSLLSAIKTEFAQSAPDKLLIANFAESRWNQAPWNGWLQNYLHGAYEEHGITCFPDPLHGYPWIPCESSSAATDWINEITNTAAFQNKYYLVQAHAFTPELNGGMQDDRRKVYGLASALLIKTIRFKVTGLIEECSTRSNS